MGIPRCAKDVDKYISSDSYEQESLLGCGLTLNQQFTPLGGEDLTYDPGSGMRINMHTSPMANISAFEIPYYFNEEQSIRVTDLLKRGTGLDDFIDACYQYMMGRITNMEVFPQVDSVTIPALVAAGQGAFGTKYGQQLVPFIRMSCTVNQIVPVHALSAYMTLWIQAATWNSTTETWVGGQNGHPVLSISYEGDDRSKFTEVVNLGKSILSSMKVCLGAGGSWNGNMMTGIHTYESLFYLSTTTTSFRAMKIISLGACNTANYWNSSGEIDPTDPWEEPDPYDPVDPPPGPPGPVDPVDPVDPIPDPDYPPIDGTSVGIYKVYKPDSSQLRSIAAKLWDPTAWEAIKQMFTNPMDAIFGLAIVPVEPHTATPEDVYLGRYNTEVQAPRVTSEYVTVDCGSVFISKFYGSYLDHDPYTKYTLYLPYVGELDINADEITGKTVSIKYHCNVVTGDTVAVVLVNNRVCYTAMGNIIRQLPLSQVDFSSVIQTAVSAAATVLTSATSISSGIASEGLSIATGNLAGAIGGQSRINNAAAQGVASTLNNVASTKLGYKHAGKIGQGAAQMSVQKPFFTVTRPNLILPEGIDGARNSSQKRYTGYPANFIDELRNFHGLTVVEECQLNMLGATDAEIAETTEILRGGVIL